MALQRTANMRNAPRVQRAPGGPRGSISNSGMTGLADGGAGAYGSRSNSVSVEPGNVRTNYGRNGSVAGAQAGVRHSISHDGGRLGATSWRSSGPARMAGNGSVGSATQGMVQHGGEATQPEWMADELSYDESQSARKMQDIEEWKRRMKEGVNVVDQQAFAVDEGAARGSRFLRMFSAPNAVDSAQSVPGGPTQGMAGPSAYANGFEQQNHDGDPLSKLFKVFGDKVSVGGASQELPLGMQQPAGPARAFGDPAVEAMMMQMARASFEDGIAPPSSALDSGASRSLSPASVATGQRVKSASPAPINEALRGIVPTSVFRKSVQSSTASSSNRSATPARNLPSWL
ncbi:hypothetical protein GGI21_006167, partial [Coemansia aciculifera]